MPINFSDDSLKIMMCMRKAGSVFSDDPFIVPGSATGSCDNCGAEIWFSPMTAKLRASGNVDHLCCEVCAVPEISKSSTELGVHPETLREAMPYIRGSTDASRN